MKRIQNSILMGLVFGLTIACGMLNLPPAKVLDNVSRNDVIIWHVVLLDGYYPVSEENLVRVNFFTARPLAVKLSFSPKLAKNALVTPSQKVEYQICYTSGETCEPQGEWKSENETTIAELALDWQNIKNVIFRARFRDAAQNPLLSLNWNDANFHPEKPPQDVSEVTYSILRVEPVKTQTPQPLPALSITQTYAATTSPIQGSIVIAPGTSAIGGTADSIRQVPVVFSATSPFGKVTEMVVNDGDWEAFISQKEYPVAIILNWSTVRFCVKYRDEIGNVSSQYCDNKGVEGSPAPSP
jgi:hypothetical protein